MDDDFYSAAIFASTCAIHILVIFSLRYFLNCIENRIAERLENHDQGILPFLADIIRELVRQMG